MRNLNTHLIIYFKQKVPAPMIITHLIAFAISTIASSIDLPPTLYFTSQKQLATPLASANHLKTLRIVSHRLDEAEHFPETYQ